LVCIATEKELYKPNPTLFTSQIIKEWDKEKSFFCGDALGRVADWADSDLKFANNIGINVKQPEEIFPFINEIKKELSVNIYTNNKQEMIIMVGLPGSGKSTIAQKFASNYKIISGDVFKTMPKMLKYTEMAIQDNLSVIIDSTNPSKKRRAEFINIANKYNIPVKCIHMTTSLEEAVYRNNKRYADGNAGVPKIVYNIYKKNFEEPSEDEGCTVIKMA
jgi:bifunctional polynucleotide phosphatase/kinase